MVNGFTTVNDILTTTITNGQKREFNFNKTAPSGVSVPANGWGEFLTNTQVPAAMTFSGTAGTNVQLNSSTVGAIPLTEGNVSPAIRTLLNFQIKTTSTNTGLVFVLCDFLLYYPSLVVTGTPTTITNAVSLPRYTNGKGVMAIILSQTTFGAASPALTFTYVGSDTSSYSTTVTAPANSIANSTLLVSSKSPYLPLSGGAQGITSLTSYTIAAGTTGTAVALFCKPLATICAQNGFFPSEKDFLYQYMSLPTIQDGACLGWFALTNATYSATTVCSGKLAYGWK